MQAAPASSSRGLVGGVSTGLLGKVAGACINLLSVPIALRVLGQERYAAFAALLGLAGWLTIGNPGLGTATSVLISEVVDVEARRRFFWRAVISTLLAVGAIGAFAFVPFTLLSESLSARLPAGVTAEFAAAAYYCFFAFLLMAVGSTFQGFYVGTLRIELLNWCTLAAQCGAIVALLTLPRWFGNMLTMCFCVTLGSVATAVWAIVNGSMECPPPRPFRYSLRRSIPLFREGLGFLASSLSTLFYTGASLWLIALTFGSAQLATAAVMSRILQMYLSLLALLLIPLAPALRNALAAGDREWLRKTLGRAGAFMGGAALCTAAGLILFGRWIIAHWTATQLPALHDWLLPLAVLIVATTWAYFWIYVCFALRGSGPVAVLAIVEVAVISALFVVLGGSLPTSASMLIMAGAMTAFSGTVLPILAARNLRRLKNQQ